MNYKIQSLVFPIEEKHQQCRKLFYRGDHGILDRNKNEIKISYAQRIDFTTYLNACSYQKWKKYTNCKSVSISLDVTGDIRVLYLGYSKEALTVNRVEFMEKDYLGSKRRKISFEYPENNLQMLGIEITALSDCTIHGGNFSVEIDPEDMQNVELSLATTTCRKEEFIKKNVDLIKKNIINSKDEIASHFTLHVTDNGRTLSANDINGKNVFLHPNINSGGSGGFARGMYESLHQKKKATHVLLMDDDVLILPESIKRTYSLLRLLKKEYRNHFISGAMLYYEDPKKQHEDIGTIEYGNNNCIFRSLKGVLDHEKLENNLENERTSIRHKNSYAAWWYCCIPSTIIEKNGLPLPIFIRCDDSEYSLRCNADIITMNGICIWHMGFATKYNTAFDKYQQYRNMAIAQSVSGVIPEANLFRVMYSSFRLEMMRFNYGAAELVVKALEDYMKGPSFLMKSDGEKITNANFELNDKLIPLIDLEDGALFNPKECYEDTPPTIKDRIIARLTWNGQRLCPKCFERNEVVPIGFDWSIQLHKIILHNKLLAINPYTFTGIYRIKDKEKFKVLMKRFKKAAKHYNKNKLKISQQYAEAKDELTSEEFWINYLKI